MAGPKPTSDSVSKKYPSLQSVLFGELHAIVVQVVLIGMIVVYLTHPFYLAALPHVKSFVSRNIPAGYEVDAVVFALLLSSVHSSAYIVFNGFFGLCDYFGWLQSYKLWRRPAMRAPPSLVRRALLEALVGQLLEPLLAFLLYAPLRRMGMPALHDPLPAPQSIALVLALSHVCNDWVFYWAHRMLHHRSVYALVHKQHHEFADTMGISAEYAHPLEQLLANIIPTLLAPVLLASHPLVLVIWLLLRLQQTYEAHSGYCFENTLWDFSGLGKGREAVQHDFHHTVNTGNYGSELLDTLFGTLGESYVSEGLSEGYKHKKQRLDAEDKQGEKAKKQ